MEHRIKDVPKHKVDLMMTTVTGIPENLDQYVDYTMMTQAEGLKFGIEHFRRRVPHCSGSLIWQLNDCWPGVSWSIIDYYGFGKAGYYYVRRAYAPVIASFKAMEDGGIELWVTNDTLVAIEDQANIELGDFAGGAEWREACAYRIGAQESRCVWRANALRVAAAPERYLCVSSAGDRFTPNRHFFAAIKDLLRPKGGAPKVSMTPISDHELKVEIEAAGYLYFVHLLTTDEKTHFSDNYFDLAPGETRTITVRNDLHGVAPDAVTVQWR
jgi:beta-mannosidase